MGREIGGLHLPFIKDALMNFYVKIWEIKGNRLTLRLEY